LINFSRGLGLEPVLLEDVLKTNEGQAAHMVELAKNKLGELRGKRLALLGLSFKPETDDIREAPSIKIIKRLLEEGAEVVVYDPVAMGNVRKVFGSRIECADSPLNTLTDADCCMVVTEWAEFSKLKPDDFKSRMKNALVIDGRRIYDPKEFSEKLDYVAIGLGKS